MKRISLEIQSSPSCPPDSALERWQDMVGHQDACAGYEFAVMTGLAAPWVRPVTDNAVVINFFGGKLQHRRRQLQLALSCWINPNELEDKLMNC